MDFLKCDMVLAQGLAPLCCTIKQFDKHFLNADVPMIRWSLVVTFAWLHLRVENRNYLTVAYYKQAGWDSIPQLSK